jgi:hypothetical protein
MYFCKAVAQQEHERDRDGRRDKRRQARHRNEKQDEIGTHHNEIAMGEVHQPHDAEDQRQASGKQRVKAAEQNALEYCVDPDHAAAPK